VTNRVEGVEIRRDLAGVDWSAMRRDVAADDFDNGRTPEQLRRSFEASYATALAWTGDGVVSTARLLADGVCNAYLTDVWTASGWRRRGIASAVVRDLLERVPGHHVALFTASHAPFYAGLGFEEEHTGMSKVVGTWLGGGSR
jgi:predicted GNAT family acetyltransferase